MRGLPRRPGRGADGEAAPRLQARVPPGVHRRVARVARVVPGLPRQGRAAAAGAGRGQGRRRSFHAGARRGGRDVRRRGARLVVNAARG